MQHRESEGHSELPAMVRQTAESFVSLVTAHLKFANLELAAELTSEARRLGAIVATGAAAAFGYVLAVVGIGLSGVLHVSQPNGFLILGGIHLSLAALAATIIATRQRAADHRIHDVVQAMTVSVTSVAGAAVSGRTPRNKSEPARAAA